MPVTVFWIMGHVATFHSALNILAELLRFADREFYLDWWNCRNMGEFWRRWNLPVHNLFIRHVARPFIKRGFTREATNHFVFILSAFAHEYIVSLSLGELRFIAWVSFSLQYVYIPLELRFINWLKLQNSNFGNYIFWINMCVLGHPIVLVLYYLAYYELLSK